MTKKLLFSIIAIASALQIVVAANHSQSTGSSKAYLSGTPNGIQDEMNNDYGLKVFPNPSQNFINFSFSGLPSENLILVVFDLNGKVIVEKTISNLNNTINVSNYNEGTYLYSITNSKGDFLKSGKFNVIK
jgi:Secretion system C-terminal sorting domain